MQHVSHGHLQLCLAFKILKAT